jgi:TRAP-type C4-dicarboxylate transport system permease small subunit
MQTKVPSGWDMPDKSIDAISKALVAAACVAILLMMVIVTADVIAKYFFRRPLENTLEIVEIYFMPMVVLLPLAYVTRDEGQLIVELFTRNFSPRANAGLDAFAGIFTLAFMLLLTWKTGEEAVTKTILLDVRQSGVHTLVAWPSRWLLPIGFGAMALAVLLRIWRDIRFSLSRS